MFYTITVKKFWVFKLRSNGAKLLFGQTILPCTKSSLLEISRVDISVHSQGVEKVETIQDRGVKKIESPRRK